MKHKVKEISVNHNDDYCLWEIDLSNIDYDCTVNVDSGCAALYIVNGRLCGTAYQQRFMINERDKRRENNNIKLIGVNLDSAWELRWGGETQFAGRDKIVYTIGIRGSFHIQIDDPWEVYRRKGHSITTGDISEEYRKTVKTLMINKLNELANKYSPTEVRGKFDECENVCKQEIESKLANGGMKMAVPDMWHLEDPVISDKYIERQIANDAKKQEQNAREDEMMFIRSFSNCRPAAAATTAATAIKTEKSCPHCGLSDIEAGIKYCPRCGKKL